MKAPQIDNLPHYKITHKERNKKRSLHLHQSANCALFPPIRLTPTRKWFKRGLSGQIAECNGVAINNPIDPRCSRHFSALNFDFVLWGLCGLTFSRLSITGGDSEFQELSQKRLFCVGVLFSGLLCGHAQTGDKSLWLSVRVSVFSQEGKNTPSCCDTLHPKPFILQRREGRGKKYFLDFFLSR